jgi:DNA-binding CsgD family transcriptional regulator
MAKTPTYEELEHQIVQLERQLVKWKQAAKAAIKKADSYRNIFNNAPVSLVHINFKQYKKAVNRLGVKGVDDLKRYLNDHPKFLHEAKQMFEIIDINDAALRLFQAGRAEDLLGPLNRVFSLESESAFYEGLIALERRDAFFEMDTLYRTFQGELINIKMILTFLSEKHTSDNMIAGAVDITNIKRMEEQLQIAHDELGKRVMERTAELLDANDQLKLQSRKLEEFNAALKVLLQSRENDQMDLEEKILLNMKNLVLPYLKKLKTARMDPDHSTYLDILEHNLQEIISPFSTNLSSKYVGLTPKEIQIAGLIRDGMTTKDIADILLSGEKTIETHRHNIRTKLGLKKEKVNLMSYLQSIANP